MVILTAAAFGSISTPDIIKVYTPGQLVYGHDMIIQIKNNVQWEFICQKIQKQVDKDNKLQTIKMVYYEYKVVSKTMLRNKASYRYETPYKGPY